MHDSIWKNPLYWHNGARNSTCKSSVLFQAGASFIVISSTLDTVCGLPNSETESQFETLGKHTQYLNKDGSDCIPYTKTILFQACNPKDVLKCDKNVLLNNNKYAKVIYMVFHIPKYWRKESL